MSTEYICPDCKTSEEDVINHRELEENLRARHNSAAQSGLKASENTRRTFDDLSQKVLRRRNCTSPLHYEPQEAAAPTTDADTRALLAEAAQIQNEAAAQGVDVPLAEAVQAAANRRRHAAAIAANPDAFAGDDEDDEDEDDEDDLDQQPEEQPEGGHTGTEEEAAGDEQDAQPADPSASAESTDAEEDREGQAETEAPVPAGEDQERSPEGEPLPEGGDAEERPEA